MRLVSYLVVATFVAVVLSLNTTSVAVALEEAQGASTQTSIEIAAKDDLGTLDRVRARVLEVRIRPWDDMLEADWSELRSKLLPEGFEVFLFTSNPRVPEDGEEWVFIRSPVVLATAWGASGPKDVSAMVKTVRSTGLLGYAYPLGPASWSVVAPAHMASEASNALVAQTRASKNIAIRDVAEPPANGVRFLIHDEMDFARALPLMPSANMDSAAWCVMATAPGVMLEESLAGVRRALHKCGCDPVGLASKEMVGDYFRVCLGGPTVPVLLLSGPNNKKYDDALLATLWSLRIPYGLELGGGRNIHVPQAYEATAKAAIRDAQEKYQGFLRGGVDGVEPDRGEHPK